MQHRLTRTGMPEKFIPWTITLIILAFTALNLVSMYLGIGKTVTFFIDIIVWGICVSKGILSPFAYY
jgi:hypothetical protein